MSNWSRAKLLGTALAVVVITGGCSGDVLTDNDPGDPAAPISTTTATSPPPATVAPTTTAPATTAAPATTLPAQPIHGGTVTIGLDADFFFSTEVDGELMAPTMNPLLDGHPAPVISRLVVPGAFRIDAGGDMQPWLVEELPTVANGGVTVAADGTPTVTYDIREEAVWEDGTPITADDLVFTHELVMRDDLRITAWSGLRGAHALVDPSSLVADGKRLTLQLTRPDPRYELLFEWVVPAHAVAADTFATDWNDAMWLSGGPFRFVSYEPAVVDEGSRDPVSEPGALVLARNPTYWETDPETGDALPYLDAIELVLFTPAGMAPQMSTWLASGSIDAALGFIASGGPETRRYILDNDDGVAALGVPARLLEVLAFQFADSRFEVNPDSLNEHLTYRQAVLAAIDRAAISAAIDADAVTSILGAAIGRLDHAAWARYDGADPGSLLAELDAALPRDLRTDPPTAAYISSFAETTRQIGDEIAAQLTAAGIATTTSYDGDFFGTQLPEGLTDLMAFRIVAGNGGLSTVLDTLSIFDPTVIDGVVDWRSVGPPAERYAELLDEASTELDLDRLAGLLAEAETILAEQAIAYPLTYRLTRLVPYLPQRIQGLAPSRVVGWDTWNAAWWWSPEG